AASETYLRAIADRASAAGALPEIKAQLGLLREESIEGELGNTIRDFFRNERKWAPFRQDHPIHGISSEGTRLGLLVGADPASFHPEAVITEARANGRAQRFHAYGDGLFAIGAARVPVAGRDIPVVLLLARLVGDATLAELGKPSGLSLVLAREGDVRGRHGDGRVLGNITSALKQATGEVTGDLAAWVSGGDGQWVAFALTLAPGWQLWSWADTAATTLEAQGTASSTRIIVWSAGALIALVALFFGFRRPPAIAVASPSEEAKTAEGLRRHPSPRQGATFKPVVEESTPTPVIAEPPPAFAPPRESESPRSVPAQRAFGRYILLSQLGEGGMARVYTAVVLGAEGFRRKFVIKRLRPEFIDDTAVVSQFIDEANMASSLVHSNIVPVLDFGKVGDEYFLATEYILGRDLSRLTLRAIEIDRHGLPPNVVLFVGHEVLKALEYAHTRTNEAGHPLSLVHRDVSPSNILVSARGEVKLFDFGIVKAEGRVSRTQHGVVKGNVCFMSPEQARGVEVDARADLFSLGLVLYSCLTGDVLYAGQSSYELLLKAATGPGPEEIRRLRALPSPLGAILEKALAVDRDARFQSATEFAAAVVPHLMRDSSELESLMLRLFAEDLRREEAAFAQVSAAGFELTTTAVSSTQGPS
ncbi:MAG TPA: serine/threonine-protein kinase, partial [Polyangia bacterium]